MKHTDLLVNLCAFAVPFLFSFHPKLKFYKVWNAFFPAAIISALLFVLWDILFTQLGVWRFNPSYITGNYFLNLPVEELLFFFCIPYCCIFSYHCFTQFNKLQLSDKLTTIISNILISFLVLTAIVAFPKLYITVTFFLLAMLLIIVKYILNSQWLGRFYGVYLVLLIPFLIVNGILTGTGLQEPVVIYNDTQNLGLRILTIPVEDVFYGMLLILLNVLLFETFKRKHI